MGPPNHHDGIEDLVTDFQKGYLTRRGFLAKAIARQGAAVTVVAGRFGPYR